MPSVTPATIGGALREAMRLPRLLLAAKTAVAVGIAWAIAPHMPGITDEYPYYAPLGALVSMYPTLMGSAKSGLQTLLGLAAGIGLATLVILTVGPTWWTIPVIVGIGKSATAATTAAATATPMLPDSTRTPTMAADRIRSGRGRTSGVSSTSCTESCSGNTA